MLPGSSHRLIILAILSLSFCPIIRSLQANSPSTAIYPNDPEGLRQLLDQMRMAAKQEDHAKLQFLIREAEIPNHEEWFIKSFGEDKGGGWGESYGKTLKKDQKDFEEFLIQLSQMEGEFSVEKVDTAKRYDTLRGPLDEYIASWKKAPSTGEDKPEHLAEFVFIDGKFRWNSTAHYFPFQTLKTGRIVMGKLVKNAPPVYPEEARRKSIQGTVVLNVILRKDGSVLVQNVAEGDPILSPAAIEAVKHWRYAPTLLNGQPIDLQTKISVVFALN
jgi:TonB family protein